MRNAGWFFLRPLADHSSGKHPGQCQRRLIRRMSQVSTHPDCRTRRPVAAFLRVVERHGAAWRGMGGGRRPPHRQHGLYGFHETRNTAFTAEPKNRNPPPGPPHPPPPGFFRCGERKMKPCRERGTLDIHRWKKSRQTPQACISHHPTVEARDTTARTSLRLLAVLNVLFKYACAPSGSRLVLTALSPTSPRRVVRNAG